MRLEYFQMIDEVVAFDAAAKSIACVSRVPAAGETPIFEGHFPGHPLMPGVLLIETQAQASGYLVLALDRFQRMPFLMSVKDAKFRTFVAPEKTLEVSSRIAHEGSGYIVTKTAIVSGKERICEAEIWLRQVPFPAPELADAMRDQGRRIGLPAETLA